MNDIHTGSARSHAWASLGCSLVLSLWCASAHAQGTAGPKDFGGYESGVRDNYTVVAHGVRPPEWDRTGFESRNPEWVQGPQMSPVTHTPIFNSNLGDSQAANGTPCGGVSPRRTNPIVISSGVKIEPETDFAAAGEMGLFLHREYNSQTGVGIFGRNWISNFDKTLQFDYRDIQDCMPYPGGLKCTQPDLAMAVWASRPDGRRIQYLQFSGGTMHEVKPGAVAKLVGNALSATLYTEDNTVEVYQNGFIQSETNAHGIGWTYTYGGLNGTQLQRVTHTDGRQINFTWSGRQLVEVRDPANNVYSYAYDTPDPVLLSPRLISATLPGSPATTVSYIYGTGSAGNYKLMGKSFNGARYSYFDYDSNGRANKSEHAGGVERSEFVYTVNGTASQTLETNPLGKQTNYSFQNGKLTRIDGLQSPSCDASFALRRYDGNGYEDEVEDFNGHKVDVDYDAHGHLLKQVEAVGTPEARITLYEWDEAKNRVVKVTVVGEHETSYGFNADNRVSTVIVKNLSSRAPGSQNQTRLTSYAYTKHPNGMLATVSVDGPLSADTVTYTYNTTGDLIEVKNGLGHATLYSAHNAMGQPGRVTGPNGDVNEYVYDARGRVTEHSALVNGVAQTVRATYNGAGRLASVQSPDGSQRNYIYDAAYRVIEEYEREPGGTYARKLTSYNEMSLPTQIEVLRSTYPYNTQVIGNIDGVASDGSGGYNIRGWACSTGQDAPIDVHMYAGGAAGSGTFSGSYPANQTSEPSVAAACAAQGGSYRFQIPLSDAVRDQYGGQAIYIHGISPAQKANLLIGASGIYFIPRLRPNVAPTGLSAPSQVTNGSYNVAWSTAPRATSYRLEESADGVAWILIHDAASTSKAVSGKSAGTYRYRVTGCNESGCGPYSGVVSVRDIDPPVAVPSLSAPSVNTNGSYTVSWTALADSTAYKLEETSSGGTWVEVQDSAATSRAFIGKHTSLPYYYRASACNEAGCGGYSATVTVQPIIYGAEFVGHSVPTIVAGGRQFGVTVQMRNTGNTTWTDADGYRLGSQNPYDNTTWGTSRISVQGAVPPGAVATFNLSPWAPGEGTYNFQWRMVRDGVAWFGATTPNVSILSVTGTISANPNPCTLYIYDSICSANISWWSSQNGSEVWVTNLDNSAPQLFYGNTKSANANAPWIPQSGKRFHLKFAGVTLATVDVYAYQTGQYPPDPDPGPGCVPNPPIFYCEDP